MIYLENYNVLITINSTSNNNSFKTTLTHLKEKKQLYYVDKDKEKTVNLFDYDNNILTRDNENIYLELKFKKNKITQNKLLIKEMNSTTYISIKTNDIIISENLILLDYNIDNEHYIYKIEKIGDINEHN